MLVSYKTAEYLSKRGYCADTRMKYWCRDKKAHSKFDSWEPIDTISAPEVIEAVNWAWKHGTKIVTREVEGNCMAEVNIDGEIKTATSTNPEAAYSKLLDLISETY